MNKALQRAGLAMDAMDLIEIQEAFAAQTLARTGMKEISPVYIVTKGAEK